MCNLIYLDLTAAAESHREPVTDGGSAEWQLAIDAQLHSCGRDTADRKPLTMSLILELRCKKFTALDPPLKR